MMMWFVVRCFQNDFSLVWNRLSEAGFEVNHLQIEDLPHLFFLQASSADALRISRTFPYLHFYKERQGSRLVLVSLPEAVMQMVQRVVSVHHPLTEYKEEGCLDHLAGKQVRVIGGDFEGVEGKCCRFQGEHHICFNVPGACTVCTPYIPAKFVERI